MSDHPAGQPGPESIPPGSSFPGMDDAIVLRIATKAFAAVQALPVGSTARARQWAMFDEAMGELGSRLLAKLREHGEDGPGSTAGP